MSAAKQTAVAVAAEQTAVAAEPVIETIYTPYIGKPVICRTVNDGVNFGYVKNLDDTGVILDKCRRLFYHKPKDSDMRWYEGVAQSGLAKDSRVGVECTKLIVEDYSLTECTEAAAESISAASN